MHGILEQFADRKDRALEFHSSTFQTGKLQQGLDQSGKLIALLHDDIEIFPAGFLIRIIRVTQRLRIADNQRERRFEVVGDIGDKASAHLLALLLTEQVIPQQLV